MSLRHPSAHILLAVGERGAEWEEGRTRDINKDVVDVQVVMYVVCGHPWVSERHTSKGCNMFYFQLSPAIGHLSCFWSFDIINAPEMNILVLIYSFIHILG